MSEHPRRPEKTFYGLILVRGAFAACALAIIGLGVGLPWLGPEDQPVDSLGEYLGVGTFMAFCVLVGAASLAVCLERVVVDDAGVHRRNAIWFDRSTPWNEIAEVRVETDRHNTHPVITKASGQTIRLRGAASLTDSPRSTAERARQAIAAGLP